MNLPKKDKDGNPYLSYSQISLFLKNKQEYYDRYVLENPFNGNAYTDFGSKVGEALESNYFSDFSIKEANTLKNCIRLDEFEKEVKLDFGNFYVIGFIDTNTKDYTRIIDYKTGGKGKELQYKSDEYTQLCYYALSLRQMYGITPKKAQVNFITRDGNAFRGEKLTVGNDTLLIDVDISYERLKKVYNQTIKIAKAIVNFIEEETELRMNSY